MRYPNKQYSSSRHRKIRKTTTYMAHMHAPAAHALEHDKHIASRSSCRQAGKWGYRAPVLCARHPLALTAAPHCTA